MSVRQSGSLLGPEDTDEDDSTLNEPGTSGAGGLPGGPMGPSGVGSSAFFDQV